MGETPHAMLVTIKQTSAHAHVALETWGQCVIIAGVIGDEH